MDLPTTAQSQTEISTPIAATPTAVDDAELYGADVSGGTSAVELPITVTAIAVEKSSDVDSPAASSGPGIPGLFLLSGPSAEADPMALDTGSLVVPGNALSAIEDGDVGFTVQDFTFAVEPQPTSAVGLQTAEVPQDAEVPQAAQAAEEPATAETAIEPTVKAEPLDTDMADKDPEKDPADPAFLAAGEANKADETAEWQLDSSSSSSSSSEDSSSSEEAGSDDDYPLMDHAQLAKLLMREDGEDDNGTHKEGLQGPLKTKNELPDIIAPARPDIVVTSTMPLSLLGPIEAIVDTLVLIKASASGAHQVLNEGSLLVLEDRSIFGVVADTLGRVEAPLYTVRFEAPGDVPAAVGTNVYYVPQHSDYVFTQALKGLKGSDASNIFDEEVADGEREFSDDEAEAEHKRQRKYARQAQTGGNRGGGGGRGASRPEVEELYTPLARPANLAELMSGPPPTHGSDGGGGGGGGGGGRGGGNRDRGGNGRGRGRSRARGQRGARGRDNHEFRKRDRDYDAPYQPRPDPQQHYPQQQQQQQQYQPYLPQQQQQQQQHHQQQHHQQQNHQQQYQPQQFQWSPPNPPLQYPQYQQPQQQQQNFYQTNQGPQFLPQGAHVNPAFLPPPGRNDFNWTPPVPQGGGGGDTEAALKALQSLVSLRNQMQQQPPPPAPLP